MNTEDLLQNLFPEEDGQYHIGKLYSVISTNKEIKIVKEYKIFMLLNMDRDFFYDASPRLKFNVLLSAGIVESIFYSKYNMWYLKRIP